MVWLAKISMSQTTEQCRECGSTCDPM